MLLKQIIKEASRFWVIAGTGLLITHATITYEISPRVYETEEGTLVKDVGNLAQVWGRDTNNDGTLNECAYLVGGFRGGGVFQFSCDLSEGSFPATRSLMEEKVEVLQMEYSTYREQMN